MGNPQIPNTLGHVKAAKLTLYHVPDAKYPMQGM